MHSKERAAENLCFNAETSLFGLVSASVRIIVFPRVKCVFAYLALPATGAHASSNYEMWRLKEIGLEGDT